MSTRGRAARPLLFCVLGLLWAAAHAVSHDLVQWTNGAGHHHHHHAAEGGAPAYFSYLPTSLALCLTLAVAIPVFLALGRRRFGSPLRALWLFGLVPVLGFAGHAAGSALGGGLSGQLFGELAPSLLIGLLVQLPFALVAVGVGRTVAMLAERLADCLPRPQATVLALVGTALAPARARIPHAWLAGRDNRPRAPPPAAFAS